jgi:hypothetical protein
MTRGIETKDLIYGKHKLPRHCETINVPCVRGYKTADLASHLAPVLDFEIEMFFAMLQLLMRDCRTVAEKHQNSVTRLLIMTPNGREFPWGFATLGFILFLYRKEFSGGALVRNARARSPW